MKDYLKKDHFREILKENNLDIINFTRLSSKAAKFTSQDGQSVAIIYINTIVFLKINNKIILNTDTWTTNTTKKWINYGFSLVKQPYYIQQKSFNWYLVKRDRGLNYKEISREDYKDNLTITI